MKTAVKKTIAQNVINFPNNKAVRRQSTRKAELVSFTLKADVYGFAQGDKIIVETSFILDELSRMALVVATNSDGRNMMTLAAAQITSADIYGVVIAYERRVRH